MALPVEQVLRMVRGALEAHDQPKAAQRVAAIPTDVVRLVLDRLSQIEHDVTDAQATRLLALAKLVIAGQPDKEREFLELGAKLQGLR
jgi:hypothetical protein